MLSAKHIRFWSDKRQSCAQSNGGPKPINPRCEVVATNGMFKYAYRYGRAVMPIDNYFEWKAIWGEKTKQPYAIAMKTGEPIAPPSGTVGATPTAKGTGRLPS